MWTANIVSPHGARAASIRTAVAVLALASGGVLAQGSSPDALLEQLTVGQLKRLYLGCNGAAIDGRLDRASIMKCSLVYEALKRRAFGGDFERLLAWSKSRPGAAAAEVAATADERAPGE